MLIDIHFHADLYLDLDLIVEGARDAGVQKIISVGMSANGLKKVLEISELYESIYPALGVHPEEVQQNKNIEKELESVIELIKSNAEKLCAIGEIGLDHHFVKDKELYPLQKRIFNAMLELANHLELPVNLHTKGAEQLVFDTLPSYTKIPNVNIHWYSGPEDLLREGIKRGYYFSITPAIAYSPPMKKVATLVDKSLLLLESDGPVVYLGKTGVPSMIREVLQAVAKIRNMNSNDLENIICENTKRIFPKVFKEKKIKLEF